MWLNDLPVCRTTVRLSRLMFEEKECMVFRAHMTCDQSTAGSEGAVVTGCVAKGTTDKSDHHWWEWSGEWQNASLPFTASTNNSACRVLQSCHNNEKEIQSWTGPAFIPMTILPRTRTTGE